MALADALSRCDLVDTSFNNMDSAICPEQVVINALDLALAQHIRSWSQSNPLVLRVIESLHQGFPLFACSFPLDWKFKNGHLYFKGCMYILPESHHTLVHSLHNSPALGHVGCFHTKAFLERHFWWPGLSTFHKQFPCWMCHLSTKQGKHPSDLTSPESDPLPYHPAV